VAEPQRKRQVGKITARGQSFTRGWSWDGNARSAKDRDEKEAWAPIVSVSLGLPADFLWGGNRRSDPAPPAPENGDIVVRGGPARFVYHGVAPLKDPIGSIEGIRDPSPFLRCSVPVLCPH
jgi:hypothetical protein